MHDEDEYRATAIGNAHKNLVKFACDGISKIYSQTDRQTDRHAYHNTRHLYYVQAY